MNPLNLFFNQANSHQISDRESPPTRTESTSSMENSALGNNLHLPTPTQVFTPLSPFPEPDSNLSLLFYAAVQMCQRLTQPTNLFENHVNVPSIWQPVHPTPPISQRSLDRLAEETRQQITQNETIESASDNDLSYSEIPRSLKRQYSDSVLNYAISQIKSGQMGTRRASAKYGIPRSTLRNKMNKNREVPVRSTELLQLPEITPEEEIQAENVVENQLLPSIKTEPSTADQQVSNLNIFMHLLNSWQNGVSPILSFPVQPLTVGQQEQKPARGKRGQYRRYDKEALQKAVEEVRAGMSVHRAGTLYGVPHSTLEYKVKDRSRKGQQQRLEAQLKKEQEELNQQMADTNLDIDCCPKLSPASTPTPSSSTN